jgi:hypothetical protein
MSPFPGWRISGEVASILQKSAMDSSEPFALYPTYTFPVLPTLHTNRA